MDSGEDSWGDVHLHRRGRVAQATHGARNASSSPAMGLRRHRMHAGAAAGLVEPTKYPDPFVHNSSSGPQPSFTSSSGLGYCRPAQGNPIRYIRV